MFLSLLLAVAAIQHTPIEQAVRGQPIYIRAVIEDASTSFAPQCYARQSGKKRFEGFPMEDRGHNRFVVRLPNYLGAGDGFEFFILSNHEHGDATQDGSADQPFRVTMKEPPEGSAVAAPTPPPAPAPDVKLEPPAPRNSQLVVTSEPSGAMVLIDGKKVGTTPFKAMQQPGAHTLQLEQKGYLVQKREFTLEPSRDKDLSVALIALPKEPAVTIESLPTGAQVLIDGAERGTTPFVGAIAPGAHKVALRLTGRHELASDFSMPAGSDLSLRFALPEPTQSTKPQLVVTSTPQGAALKIDGKSQGFTPWSAELAAGKHTLLLELEGYRAETRELEAQDNRETDATFTLQRIPGPAKVRIESDPAGATVSIDGKAVGPAPYSGELAPGEHNIEAEKEGFKGVAQQISVEAGEQLALRIPLSPASAAPGPPIIAVATEPRGAQLYLDDKLLGETPIKTKSTPGEHAMKLVLDGYVTRTATLKVPDSHDFELRLAVSLKPLRPAETSAPPDPLEVARAQVRRAQACWLQGDYPCALAGYQAAFEVRHLPDLLFNIAQVRRKQGEFKQCATAFRSFITLAPNSNLRGRAKQLAEGCEASGKGHAESVDEDVTPPKIAHELVAQAVRGQALHLEAHITDDKSGVFGPQACYRNGFHSEMKCQPMEPTGKDQYIAEVPAAVVMDGFAYYLEAYDNAANGPTRVGSPEQPNAVTIVDAPAEPVVDASKAAPSAVENTPLPKCEPVPEEPKPAAPPEALPTVESSGPSKGVRVLTYSLAGASLLGFGGAAIAYAEGKSASNQLSAGGHSAADVVSLQQKVTHAQAATNILIGVGAALGCAAIALFAVAH